VCDRADVIISVHNHHARNFQNGRKTVELRRKAVNLRPGTRVWIYSTLPCGSVETIGIVERVIRASPRRLWRAFGAKAAITKREFSEYFGDRSGGCAILLRDIRRLQPSVKLATIRRVSNEFHPPQFLKFLPDKSPELKLLLNSRRRETAVRKPIRPTRPRPMREDRG
jgi:predicted transcriptional regulator